MWTDKSLRKSFLLALCLNAGAVCWLGTTDAWRSTHAATRQTKPPLPTRLIQLEAMPLESSATGKNRSGAGKNESAAASGAANSPLGPDGAPAASGAAAKASLKPQRRLTAHEQRLAQREQAQEAARRRIQADALKLPDHKPAPVTPEKPSPATAPPPQTAEKAPASSAPDTRVASLPKDDQGVTTRLGEKAQDGAAADKTVGGGDRQQTGSPQGANGPQNADPQRGSNGRRAEGAPRGAGGQSDSRTTPNGPHGGGARPGDRQPLGGKDAALPQHGPVGGVPVHEGANPGARRGPQNASGNQKSGPDSGNTQTSGGATRQTGADRRGAPAEATHGQTGTSPETGNRAAGAQALTTPNGSRRTPGGEKPAGRAGQSSRPATDRAAQASGQSSAAQQRLQNNYDRLARGPVTALPPGDVQGADPGHERSAPVHKLHLPTTDNAPSGEIPGALVPEAMRRLVVSPKAHQGSPAPKQDKSTQVAFLLTPVSIGSHSARGNLPWTPEHAQKPKGQTIQGKGKVDGGGDGSGLLGQYYLGKNFEQPLFQRPDANINFNWTRKIVDPRMPARQPFSIRWTGKITPRFSETYTFYTASDDGVRLYIDGKLLIDNWSIHAASEDAAQMDMKAGQAYPIVIEYYEKNGNSVEIIKLYWESLHQLKEYVPQSCFSYPKTDDLNGH
ncbi:hypothetical protein CCAX7_21650 [Capsulimonas corticalis]|uniref:Uncharacterized protein n=1 Tax=Capsulimonas corticalis TaxID=2219043 RepID=A0A402D1Y4_9BACT|nr:PA14 domain-containing protein [Capsulimonas corticalis]BDI30114.1 hypothetical protein CCAX7_21650 [Capsulimonas corticalis]